MSRLILSLLLALTAVPAAADYACVPTAPDAQGPFYREDAPQRNMIGTGYLLFGEVRSAADCKPIPAARIEVWTTGPDGRYDDRWRATLYSDETGRYYFESHVPGPYGNRPPHIHLIVNASGYAELVTQHYPQPGSGMGLFDLVLIPQKP